MYNEDNKMDVLILAAGQSKRMGGDIVKVMLGLGQKKVIDYTLDLAERLKPSKIGMVIGFQAELVRKYCSNRDRILFIEQKERLGTGHAVLVSEPFLGGDEGFLLVLNGDVPLLSAKTIKAMIELHQRKKPPLTILTTILDNPFNYGRIIRNNKDEVIRIVEEKDTSDEEKKINEINAGIYLFQKKALFNNLFQLNRLNNAKEYYLTDLIQIFSNQKLFPQAYCTMDNKEILGINTPADYKLIQNILFERKK